MGCGGSVEEQAAIGRAAADWQAANTPTPTTQTASPPGAPFQPFQSQVPVAQPQMAMPVGGVAAVPMAMAVPGGQAPVVVDATPMGVVSGVVLPDSQRGGTSSGVVEEIEKLHQMKIKGILTEAQFQAAKDKVLAQPAMPGTETVTTTTTTTGGWPGGQ